jgi:hypothetical protein
MDDATMVSQLTGCSQEEASRALLDHETVVDAVESLLPPAPVVSGSKYIPLKPILNTGLTAEQKELCERGRWLQDKVNAVFSVAHSKTLPLQDDLPEVHEYAQVPPVSPVENSESSPIELPQDAVAQIVLPTLQSETLPQRYSSLQYVVSNVLLAQNTHSHCPTNESQ